MATLRGEQLDSDLEIVDSLQVDNININGTVIESSAGVSLSADGVINIGTLNASANINLIPGATSGLVAADGNILGLGTIKGLGDINGYVIKYNTTTAITVTAGAVEANGALYTLAADASHSMTSLASGFDFHYIYIDDDASTAPAAVIIDATTEPAWSDAKRGWYNGNDRCIGVVYSQAASATVDMFETLVMSDKFIRSCGSVNFYIATGMNPTDAWQIPDDSESSVYLPVTATEANIMMSGGDAGTLHNEYVASAEFAAVKTALSTTSYQTRTYEFADTVFWVALGASRNVRIGGRNDDDNVLAARINGYGYSR